MIDEAKRQEVVAAADRYVGGPFKLGGRDPATGIDCIALVIFAARDCGLYFPDDQRFTHDIKGSWARMESVLDERCDRVQGEPQVGDVLGFWWNHYSRRLRHIGICAGETFIHVYNPRVLRSPFDVDMRRNLYGVWSFRDSMNGI